MTLGLVDLKTINEFKRQMSYLRSKNYNLGYTDLGRNPNSILITKGGLKVFMGKREEVSYF